LPVRPVPRRFPWTDRSGRFSPLKAVVFAGLFLPALWIAWKAGTGGLGQRPLNQGIHEIGSWSVRFLILSLAVTPARRILDWPKLILVRRQIGLAALAYAVLHLALYVADENGVLSKVVSEIVLRVYLTIGFVALLGLAVLGATSTDAAIRRLGGNWNRLHRLVYPIAVLALVHHFLQAKVDVTSASLMTGFFLLLMAYRLLARRGLGRSPVALAVTGVAAGLATGAIEVAWYGLATGVPWERVLQANLDPSVMIRPSWWVAAAGLAVAAAAAVRRRAADDGRGPARSGAVS
jgi:sulfoxide reductase heme-binding subunit YedZ